ncbi:MAG: hypothetical protein ACLQIB_03315 [Isosphaeraceae bacterium]
MNLTFRIWTPAASYNTTLRPVGDRAMKSGLADLEFPAVRHQHHERHE